MHPLCKAHALLYKVKMAFSGDIKVRAISGLLLASAGLTAAVSGSLQNWWALGVSVLIGLLAGAYIWMGHRKWMYMALSVLLIALLLINVFWLGWDMANSDNTSIVTSGLLFGSVLGATAGVGTMIVGNRILTDVVDDVVRTASSK